MGISFSIKRNETFLLINAIRFPKGTISWLQNEYIHERKNITEIVNKYTYPYHLCSISL